MTSDSIINAVAKAANITPQDIIGQSRIRSVAVARHTSIYLVRTHIRPMLSYEEIGRLFGNRHYATIMSSMKQAECPDVIEFMKSVELGDSRMDNFLARLKEHQLPNGSIYWNEVLEVAQQFKEQV